MKKLLFGAALTLTVAGTILPVQNLMAQEVASVGSIGKGVNWLAKRIYSIDVDTLAYDMEKDGVVDRQFVAVFTAKGALIQNYELSGSRSGLDQISREAGMQILPYTVSVSNDGRKFLSVGAFAMKSMNTAYYTAGSTDGGTYKDSFWTVMNSIEAVVYEYDDGLYNNNTETHKIKLVQAEVKLDILGSSKPGHFLALVGGGNVGWQKQSIVHDGGKIYIAQSDSEEYKKMEMGAEYKIGLEYNLPMGKKNNLNASVMLNGGRIGGYNVDANERAQIEQQNAAGLASADATNAQYQQSYNASVAQYEHEKEEYEQANFNGTSISDESYEALSGNYYPAAPNYVDFKAVDYEAKRAARTYMYLSPKINFSGNINKGTSYELSVFGNIPLRDDVNNGGVKVDLSGSNARPIVGAGIKVKF